MFDYLEGQVAYSSEKEGFSEVTLAVGGCGYRLHLPLRHHREIIPAKPGSVGSELTGREAHRFYIYYHAREGEAPELYGFNSRSTRDFFVLLLHAPGVGPKIALAITHEMTPDEGSRAIQEGNTHRFTAISGIGKKIAERMFLELKGKVEPFLNPGQVMVESCSLPATQLEGAVQALVNLGHPVATVRRMIGQILAKGKVLLVEDLIRQALTELSAG